MPLFQYICKKEHITEKLDLRSGASELQPKVKKCPFVFKNGHACDREATLCVGHVATIFQPYCFSDTCFSSYSDRKQYFENPNVKDLGAAHKDAKQKLPPNRQFTRFKGKKVSASK